MNVKKIKLFLSDMFKQNDILITTNKPNCIIRTNLSQMDVSRDNPHVNGVVHYITLSAEITELLLGIIPLDQPGYQIDLKLLLNAINKVKVSVKLETLPTLASDITRVYPKQDQEIYCFEITKDSQGTLTAFTYDNLGDIVKEVSFGVLINEHIVQSYHRWSDVPKQEDILAIDIDKLNVKKFTEWTMIPILQSVGVVIKDGITSVSINSYAKKIKQLDSCNFKVKWYLNDDLVSPYIEYQDEYIHCISIRPTMRLLFDQSKLLKKEK